VNRGQVSTLHFCAKSFSRLAFVLILALAVAGPVAGQTLPVGPFGFVANATFNDPASGHGGALLGLANFDGAGNVNGPYTLELGFGSALGGARHIHGTFTGTYSSNPDGTGSMSITLDIGVNLAIAMVINNHGRGLELALTGCTGAICDFPGVSSGVGAAVFTSHPHPVDTQFLTGSYGVQITKSAPTVLTELAVWTFDGAGNVSLSETLVSPGFVVASGTLTGTYTVNPDGTGTVTVPPQPGSLLGQTYAFVITNSHSGLLVLQTNRLGDGVLYGVGQLQ
jgi:hypothetical protein